MTATKCRMLFARLTIVILVLLVGGVAAWAQEQQKEPPKKVEERGGKKGEARPAKRPEKQAAPQQTPPVLQRGQQSGQKPPETGQRATQPRTDRPVQQPPQRTPPPTAVQRGEPNRPPQGGRPAANEAQQGRQGGRPAANEAQQGRQGPQGDARRTTGFWSARPSQPGHVVTTRGGDTVHRDQAGRVTQVRVKNGAVVYHAPNGVRHVEIVHPGNRVIVAEAPGHGFVQRPLVFHDRRFVKRTYFYGGVSYARVYRPMTYRGAVFDVYTPVRYYRPGFYAYVFNPWRTPVAWSWGWGGSPWYGYYGGYFTPYPYYRSPALWLTDYFIAATLQAAYQERLVAGVAPAPAADGEVTLSPEVKQLVADEVRRQIEYERAESQSAAAGYPSDERPEWADNASHVFVAYTALDVSSNGGYCTIGEGDVLQMNSMPPPYSATANLVVLASRRRHCRQGSFVSVDLQDLQDMSNRMRETVEAGLSDLQARQGQRGIPPLPSGAAGTVDTPLAAEAAPDANAGAELNEAYRDTDQAEQAAIAQAGDASAGTPTVSLGQTIDQVRAILGPPQQIMDAGAKQIYIYRTVKITFVNGRVNDIQ